MKNDLIRIILVDDNKILRDSWKILLENIPGFQVIADFENGKTAIEQVQKLDPDIILVDINMTPINGFIITESILKINPSLKIIGLSVNNQPKSAIMIMELGARGYLTKTSSLKEITNAILKINNGEFYICEEVAKKMPISE